MKDAPRDPLDDVRLPCDVKVGGSTFRKGVPLSTFVAAARMWHREAFPDFYTLTKEQKAANLAHLRGQTVHEVIQRMNAKDEARKAALAKLPPGACGTCLGDGVLGNVAGQRIFECPDCDGKGKRAEDADEKPHE